MRHRERAVHKQWHPLHVTMRGVGGLPSFRARFSDRAMPYFIDADGTRCAMAHLLELGGAAALVARIANEKNNAFVEELANGQELPAWLDASGLSVAEAARIQPDCRAHL